MTAQPLPEPDRTSSRTGPEFAPVVSADGPSVLSDCDPTEPAIRLQLSSPAALVASVPGLLGFHPRCSAVLVALADGRVRVSLRADLPGEAADETAWASDLVPRVRRAAPDADEVVVVLYPLEQPGHRDLLPWQGLVHAIDERLVHAGLTLRDALCVTESRWFSYLCSDEACCDPHGNRLDGPEATYAQAGFALAGVAPVPDRDALGAELDRAPDDVVDLVAVILDELMVVMLRLMVGDPSADGVEPDTLDDMAIDPALLDRWRADMVDAVVALLQEGIGDERDVAEVLLGLTDVRVRDTVMWDLTNVRERALWLRAAEVLVTCVRSAPAGWVAPAATLLALCRWQVGDGARASEALGRALDDDPGYSLARLVEQSLSAGLPPAGWADAMDGLRREQCLQGVRSRRRRR